jgi:hypothetical protein
MNAAFLVFANVVLLARLFVLFKDDAVGARPWAWKTFAELAVLFLWYAFSPGWLGAAVVVVAMNFISWRWEIKARRKNLGRLLLGLAEFVALSVFFAPAFNLTFRPGLEYAVQSLGELTVLAPFAQIAGSHPLQLKLFGLLLAANEANLAIRAVFDLLDLKPRSLPAGQGVVDVGEFNRGRVIGLLERVLLYLFILQGHYGAIGFILAAKAFTRFKALDDRPFAEYVLIGTLLSACLALAAGGLVQWLLMH